MARNGMWKMRAYHFVADRDPECDRFETLFAKESIGEDDLAALAGLATQTVHRMFNRETRQPRHSTFAKLASAMGHEYGLNRIADPDYSREIPKAKKERKEYRDWLRKKKQRTKQR